MIEQLAQLNELAPDICRANLAPTPVQYFIGEYGFWVNPEGELIACPMGLLDKNIGGRFASAWLRDAIEGEIERRGWTYHSGMTGTRYCASIYLSQPFRTGYVPDIRYASATEALLAAFLAAVEREGR